MPFVRQRSNNALSFASWWDSASAWVSPTRKTRISSKIGFTPSRPSRAHFSLLWNSSGAGEILNGIRVYRNISQGLPTVVRRLLSSSSCTCQNPFLASTTLKTLTFVSSGSRSSSLEGGSGFFWVLDWGAPGRYTALFSCCSSWRQLSRKSNPFEHILVLRRLSLLSLLVPVLWAPSLQKELSLLGVPLVVQICQSRGEAFPLVFLLLRIHL